jgi:hypothetical protein
MGLKLRALRARALGLLLLLAAPLPIAAGVEGESADDFRVQGELLPQRRSDDGRFVIKGELQMQTTAASSDGRFRLKAGRDAGCNPNPDVVYANGFEGLTRPAQIQGDSR